MVHRGNGTQERNGSVQSLQGSKKKSLPVVRDTAVSGQRWWWPRLLKLASLVLFVALFVRLNNLVFRVRVPVSVFYLNMSKKGKKQDVKDCLETIQQDNTIGMISPFLFAINHRKFCSKRHLKNIILLNIDLCACRCERVRACLCVKNNKAITA